MNIQMKGMLGSMNEGELHTMLQQLIQAAGLQVDKSSKMISYKCYECTYVCGDKKANGYGRNEKEANGNCIRNLLEFLLEDEQIFSVFNEYLTNGSNKKPADMHSENSKLTSQQQQQPVFCSQPAKPQDILTSQGTDITPNNLTFNNQQQFDLQQQANKATTTPNSNSNALQFYNSLNLQSNTIQSQKASFSQFASISTDGSKTPQPIHKHSRNRSTTNNPNSSVNYCSIQLSQDLSTKSIDKDTRLATLEEELKRAKSIINHLERKVKLVIEENKILKSLLVENKKGAASTIPINTINIVPKSYNPVPSATTNHAEFINNENIPPSVIATSNTTKQAYFIPSVHMSAFPSASSQAAPSFNVSHKDFQENSNKKAINMDISQNNNTFYGNQNNSISYSNQNNPANYASTSNRNQKILSDSTNQNGFNTQQQQQSQSQQSAPLQILKEYSSKANIILNQQTTPQAAIQILNTQLTAKTPSYQKPSVNSNNIPLPPSQQIHNLLDAENHKPTIEKFRSLSLDVNGRRSTMRTDNSFKKLDTSYTEATSNNQLLGHRRCKSRIPKLNLEVLPNYHGNSNKSINDQLLISYQNNQQQQQQVIKQK